MHPDFHAIVSADEAARRDVDVVSSRIAADLEQTRTRLLAERAAADLDASVRRLEKESLRRAEARRLARERLRVERRNRAEAALSSAVSSYQAIIRNGTRPSDTPGVPSREPGS